MAKSLGFTSAGYFSRFFKKETGQTPQEFRTSG
nr:AraC family transcriptional regulator [Paenibacillus luteus]